MSSNSGNTMQAVKRVIRKGVFYIQPSRISEPQEIFHGAAHAVSRQSMIVRDWMDHYKSIKSSEALEKLASQYEDALPLALTSLREERERAIELGGFSGKRRLGMIALYLEGCAIAFQYLCEKKMAYLQDEKREKTAQQIEKACGEIEVWTRCAAMARGESHDAKIAARQTKLVEGHNTRPLFKIQRRAENCDLAA